LLLTQQTTQVELKEKPRSGLKLTAAVQEKGWLQLTQQTTQVELKEKPRSGVRLALAGSGFCLAAALCRLCRRTFCVQPDDLTRHAHHSAVEAAATWPHPPSRFHVVPLPLRSRRDGTLPRGEGKLGFGLAAALAVARLPCLTVRADR
jgi:hypothetical protein